MNQVTSWDRDTHRDDISVDRTHLNYVGIIWLVSPHGGIVVDVQDGDVHLNSAGEGNYFH